MELQDFRLHLQEPGTLQWYLQVSDLLSAVKHSLQCLRLQFSLLHYRPGAL